MKIIAVPGRCEAHGQCAMAAGDLFPLDGDGYIAVGDGVDVAQDRESDARRGVDACPLAAIRLLER